MGKKLKKEIIEWGLLITVASALYFSGQHTEVLGFVQRAILATGLLQPDQIPKDQQTSAAYDFELRDINGESVDFSTFKGKTVFLNFWATWCPPCIAEMPDIHDLYNKVQNEDIVFVMLSQDKDFQKAIDYIKKKEYDFPVYSLNSRLPQVYHSQSIPTTFVISPKGKIVSKRSGMAKYDTEKFRDFLTQLSLN